MAEDYTCPHCQNPIYDEEALLCHFCGNSLKRAGKGLMSQMKYGNRLFWFFGLLLLMIVVFSLIL